MRFDINKLKSGRIQIAAHRTSSSNGYALTYQSPKEATEVLLALGFDQKIVNQAFATIDEFNYGPQERYSLPEIVVTDELVRQNGFLL
jgi:hypothetical protein